MSVATHIDKELSATWYLVYQLEMSSLEVGITNSLIADHHGSFLYRPNITKASLGIESRTSLVHARRSTTELPRRFG